VVTPILAHDVVDRPGQTSIVPRAGGIFIGEVYDPVFEWSVFLATASSSRGHVEWYSGVVGVFELLARAAETRFEVKDGGVFQYGWWGIEAIVPVPVLSAS
jgi:hypothetical protein